FGWSPPTPPQGSEPLKVPGPDTLWRQQGSGALAVGRPVTLSWDNGAGLEFRRTIAVDENYLFTIKDEVVNRGAAPVTLTPYGSVARHGTPTGVGYGYILHEGFIGVLGDKLVEETYADVEKKKTISFSSNNAWLGFTDKYWGAALLPLPSANLQAQFRAIT